MKEFIKEIGGSITLDKTILVHNYNDFKKTEKGNEMIKTYLDRWNSLGFINGLEGELRERCAVAMEQLEIYLITENENNEYFEEPFETISFPIIRRVVCGSVGNKLNNLDSFNFEKFIKYCKELNIIELMNEVGAIVGNTTLDVEVETCAVCCEMIINRFNGDERSFDEAKSEYIDKIRQNVENYKIENDK